MRRGEKKVPIPMDTPSFSAQSISLQTSSSLRNSELFRYHVNAVGMSASINTGSGMHSVPVSAVGVAPREPRAPAPRSESARRSTSNIVAAALGKTRTGKPNYYSSSFLNPSGNHFGSAVPSINMGSNGGSTIEGSMNPLLSSRSSGSIDFPDREVVLDEGKRFASASSVDLVEKATANSGSMSNLLACEGKRIQASGNDRLESSARSARDIEDEELDVIIEDLRAKLAPSAVSKPTESEEDNHCQQRKHLKNPVERVSNSLANSNLTFQLKHQPSGKYLIGSSGKQKETGDNPETDCLSVRGPSKTEEDGPEGNGEYDGEGNNNNQTNVQVGARIRSRGHSSSNTNSTTTTFGRNLAAARAAAVPQTSRHRTLEDFYLEMEEAKGWSGCKIIESLSPVGPWMATDTTNSSKSTNQRSNQPDRLSLKLNLKSDPATLSPRSKLLWISEQSFTSNVEEQMAPSSSRESLCSSVDDDSSSNGSAKTSRKQHPPVPMLGRKEGSSSKLVGSEEIKSTTARGSLAKSKKTKVKTTARTSKA